MKKALGLIVLFIAWNVAIVIPVFALPAPLGVLVALLLSVLVLMRYVIRAGRPGERRRRATLRLRPIGRRARGWMLLAVPVTLGLSWALGEVYTGMVPVPADTFNPFGELLSTPMGRLSAVVLAVGIAPILEEFVFRGLLQRSLERRLGTARAIFATAALFGAAHMLPWVFPLHLFLGLVFGFVVYATRSIWAGVLLHAANNSLAVFGLTTAEPYVPEPTIWETGPTSGWWLALVLLLPATLVAIWLGRKLWQAGHGRSGQHLATPDLLVSHVSR